jgi:hypothetical protein
MVVLLVGYDRETTSAGKLIGCQPMTIVCSSVSRSSA